MLQDPEIAIHRLRLQYLTQMQDGIGERIIDFSRTKVNTTAFRIAGGDSSIMNRCISPDIPTHEATDFIQVHSRTDLSRKADDRDRKVDMSRTLSNLIETVSGSTAKPRNLEHSPMKFKATLNGNETSDLSEPSDDDTDDRAQALQTTQKHLAMIDLHNQVSMVEEPKFDKIPIKARRRGISDPSSVYNRFSTLPAPRRPALSQQGSDSDGISRTGDQSMLSSDSGLLYPNIHEANLTLHSIPSSPPLVVDQVDFMHTLDALDHANGHDSDDTEYDVPDVLGGLSRQLTASPMAKGHRKRRSLTNSSLSPPTLATIPKTRPRPESIVLTSNLTLLIKASEATVISPLEQRFGIFNGSGEAKALRLKIYRPSAAHSSKPFSVVIKTTATVLDTIGYSLLRYTQDDIQPPLTDDQNDPNAWTLRIVEDDGELDEDFPALDRSRPICKFSFDEFGLVEATEAQAFENAKTTPNPPTSTRRGLNPIPETQISESNTLSRSTSNLLLPSNAASSSPMVNNSLNPIPRLVARAPGASVLLKIKLKPDQPGHGQQYAQSTVLDVTTETYLGDVLDQVCKRRNLDKFMFSLRIAGSNVVVPSDRTVESLQGRTELLLVRKKATDLFTDAILPRSMTPNAPIVAAAGQSARLGGLRENSGLSKYMPDIVTSNTYQRWVVWRRQPMSFMGRHERILAIDGEYVHISPSESKTMFESPKTSSLHVGQIIACKQSRKIPINFKIMIIKAGQTKRYDLEAISSKEAETIVAKIKILTRNYAIRTNTRHSRVA